MNIQSHRRFWSRVAAVVLVASALMFTGCDGDYYYKKGQYDKAYVEYVKTGGMNEVTLEKEVANGGFDSRNSAGNQAIHDYYYAADCSKRLGNTELAKSYYRKVVDLSAYNIRIPQDKSALLQDDFGYLENSIRNFRNREVYLSTQPTTNTDPYSGGGSTDPYSGGSSGGSTDPYANSAKAAAAPSDDWDFRAYYSNINSYRRDFEKKLYSATSQEMPDIENVKREYDRFSRALDLYLTFSAPGGLLNSPNSLGSAIAYAQLETALTSFRRVLYSAKGNITYIGQPISLKEPQLVSAAKTELGTSSTSPASGTIPSGVNRDTSTEY